MFGQIQTSQTLSQSYGDSSPYGECSLVIPLLLLKLLLMSILLVNMLLLRPLDAELIVTKGSFT